MGSFVTLLSIPNLEHTVQKFVEASGYQRSWTRTGLKKVQYLI